MPTELPLNVSVVIPRLLPFDDPEIEVGACPGLIGVPPDNRPTGLVDRLVPSSAGESWEELPTPLPELRMPPFITPEVNARLGDNGPPEVFSLLGLLGVCEEPLPLPLPKAVDRFGPLNNCALAVTPEVSEEPRFNGTTDPESSEVTGPRSKGLEEPEFSVLVGTLVTGFPKVLPRWKVKALESFKRPVSALFPLLPHTHPSSWRQMSESSKYGQDRAASIASGSM